MSKDKWTVEVDHRQEEGHHLLHVADATGKVKEVFPDAYITDVGNVTKESVVLTFKTGFTVKQNSIFDSIEKHD